MTCIPIRDGDRTVGFICVRGRPRAAPCFYCRASHQRLCDAVVAPGKTCDRKLCLQHAHAVGPDRDLCPDHDTAAHRDGREEQAVEQAPKLRFFTGNVNLHRQDPDALDITIMTGGPAGRPFAPSLGIFEPARREIERVEKLRLEAIAAGLSEPATAARLETEAAELEQKSWAWYRRAFLAEMLVSSEHAVPPGWEPDVREAKSRGVVPHVEAWTTELRRERRVFLCYCKGKKEDERPVRCHRALVAQIFLKMGATDGGELPRVPRNPNQLSLLPTK